MKTLAKITAITLIVAGILGMLLAFVVAIGGAIGLSNLPAMARLGPARLLPAFSFLTGAGIFGQGLLMVAFGEALYLLAGINGNLVALFNKE
jgi:hypothetical protein